MTPTTPTDRSEAILQLLRADGRVDVVIAAERLGVAPETVRRDLRSLERAGRLVRVHGGAVPPPSPAVATRSGGEVGDAALAAAVWAHLPRTGTMFLGEGPHCRALAEAIVADPPSAEPGRDQLQVVTHGLDVAVTLSRVGQLRVFNIGGLVSPRTHAQEGEWALADLRRFHVDVAVLSPVGVGPDSLSESTPAAAALARAAVAAARELVVLADDRTLGASGFVDLADVAEASTVIVAGDPGAARVAALVERGVEVRLADSGPRGAAGRV